MTARLSLRATALAPALVGALSTARAQTKPDRHERWPRVRRPQRRPFHGLDKDNGDLLWEFTTDAGVNSTATTFERGGKQYLVVHAGGGVFANGKRGDGIWMFSLDGTIESLEAQTGASAIGAARAEAAAAAPPPAAAGAVDLENGARLYREACLPCHGPTGAGGAGRGAALTRGLTRDAALGVISAGRNSQRLIGSKTRAWRESRRAQPRCYR